jgi:hypothetical protein
MRQRYLRVLFVQAAWVVLIRPKNWKRHGLKAWLETAKKRLHRNVLAIALANKLARIAWSVLARGRALKPPLSLIASRRCHVERQVTCTEMQPLLGR